MKTTSLKEMITRAFEASDQMEWVFKEAQGPDRHALVAAFATGALVLAEQVIDSGTISAHDAEELLTVSSQWVRDSIEVSESLFAPESEDAQD